MYCSACGAQIAEALNFCSRCGTPSERNFTSEPDPARRTLVIGASVIGVVGLMVLMPLMRTLLQSRLETPAVVMILLAYLVTLMIMFSVTMGMAWRSSGASGPGRGRQKKTDDTPDAVYRPPASFRAIDTAQLHPGEPGFGSVTDSTTRMKAELPTADARSAYSPPHAAIPPPSITNPLDEFREPASVTESTTRTLGKVSIERNK
ncbi:MAG: zinc ribbon domain-containing protein [Pyrinomonadaceae bacterium]